jgi:hypothetical protein
LNEFKSQANNTFSNEQNEELTALEEQRKLINRDRTFFETLGEKKKQLTKDQLKLNDFQAQDELEFTQEQNGRMKQLMTDQAKLNIDLMKAENTNKL